MMKLPAITDVRPTRTEPRRLIAVAPQITASATTHSTRGFIEGTKYRRYWLNSTG
jgi:hypothetical protein